MITGIILSHNDESTIGKTLESLGWCDGLLVIDDDSSDNTREIAKKHHATVFLHSLGSDFASQRNFAISKAGGDWILFIDSDEVISRELADEIANLTQNVIPAKAGILASHNAGSPIPRSDRGSGMTECDGFFIKRRDYMWGRELKYGETAHVKLLRLAKKDAGLWERPIHEVWNVKGNTGLLVHPILHYPHPNVAQFLDSINRYSSLNARYMYDHNVRSPWWTIVVNPLGKFLDNYIIKLGFLDGTAGMIVAIMMSFHSFLTRGKLYVLSHSHTSYA